MFRHVPLHPKPEAETQRATGLSFELRAELERLLPERNYLVSENARLQGIVDTLAQLLNRQSDTNRLLATSLGLVESRERDLARKTGEHWVYPEAQYSGEARSDQRPTTFEEKDEAFLNQRPQRCDD